ncbi:ABC transporter permease [Calidifontibacter sp. DB0510]|uniref:ABC transporter permease n=2 Tax=Metallococcus carri TaxID=1656884 RepID=A0A967E9Q4_9MICO|nr:ABC transporter permease [Metallococcus carri]NOP38346.1 ABC transporter permease [Calidifontibacter sp. DB2511S]
MRRHKALVYTLRVVLLVAVLAIWEISCTYLFDDFYYSKPSKVWNQLVVWFTQGTSSGSIWVNISATLQEAVYGFILGSIFGVVSGIILGRSRLLSEVLAPYIQALNAIPRVVLAALFVLWFGLGMTSKVVTALVLVFFPVFFNAFQGAREVDRNLVNNARILGASRWDVLRSIVVPSATSWILASLHTAFGFALIGAIVGEYTGATHGLGLLINTSQNSFNAAGVFAGMVICTVLALTAELFLGALERRLLKWRPPAQSTGATAV